MNDIPESFAALTFSLAGETFAIDANLVRELLEMIPITEVPGARSFVGGLINVRGLVVPLADLRLKFGMPQTEPTVDTRIVVVELDLDGEQTIVGLLADKVYEVTEIANAAVEATPDIGMKWRPDFVKGIAKHEGGFIILPDLSRLFTSD